jgi:hypothetical protein
MGQWSEVDFHDGPHVRSNISQLTHLYLASGLEAESFRAVMYQARKITLQHSGSIRKRAADSEWQKNRAPYFFQVLREQLGLPRTRAPVPRTRVAPPAGPAMAYEHPRPPEDPADYLTGPYGRVLKARMALSAHKHRGETSDYEQ